jgi:hypothetical protein
MRDFRTIAASWIAFAGMALAVLGLPLFLGLAAIERSTQNRLLDCRENDQRYLRQTLASLERYADSGTFFEHLLREFWRKVGRTREIPRRFLHWKKNLQNAFPGLLTMMVIKPDGTTVRELSDTTAPLAVAQPLMAILRTGSWKAAGVTAAKRPFLARYLGSAFPLDQIPTGRVVPANTHEKGAWIFISPPLPSGNRLLVFLNRTPAWELAGIRFQIRAFNRNGRGAGDLDHLRQRAHLVHVSAFQRLPETMAAHAPLLRFLTAPPGTTPEFFRHRSRIWTKKLIKPQYFLGVSHHPVPVAPILARRRQGEQFLKRVLGAGLIGLLLLQSGLLRMQVSLQLQLIFLFLYALILPLITLSVAAGTFVEERRAYLTRLAYEQVESTLRAFDLAGKNYRRECRDALAAVLSEPLAAGPAGVAEAKKRAVLLAQRFGIQYLFFADGEKVLEDWTSGHAADDKVANLLTRRNMYIRMKQGLLKGQGDVTAADEAKELARSPETALFEEFARNLGQIRECSIFGGTALVQIQALLDLRQGFAGFLAMAWRNPAFERLYVRQALAIFSAQDTGSGHTAVPRQRTRSDAPLTLRERVFVRHLAGPLAASSNPVHRFIVTDTAAYFAVGLHGEHLKDFDLFGWQSDENVRDQIQRYQCGFRFLMLGVFAVGLTLARILSQSLLEPIAHLADGIQALRDRQFHRHLPVVGNDELASLSATFNHLMAELQDLETARSVQESLYPAQPLAIDDWTIYGTCVSAIQVGGDYFDYFPVGDHGLGLIIGDISGHGTGSAVAMGLIKGLLSTAEAHLDAPAQWFDQVNQDLLDVLRRKKMMSCLLALFDMSTGTVRLVNAGHNYPYRVAGHSCEEIKLPGLPLGSSKKGGYSCLPVPFAAAQAWVFYTDGLIEALLPGGEQIGYERFTDALPALIGPTAAASCQAIRDWHRTLARPGPADDDITIVVLQHQSRIPLTAPSRSAMPELAAAPEGSRHA